MSSNERLVPVNASEFSLCRAVVYRGYAIEVQQIGDRWTGYVANNKHAEYLGVRFVRRETAEGACRDMIDRILDSPPSGKLDSMSAAEVMRIVGTMPDATGKYGHCDTCGRVCDSEGCTGNRSHEIAIYGAHRRTDLDAEGMTA